MNATIARAAQEDWPELPLAAWQDTYATLHMWSQIVGKVRLALSPRLNQWWEVPLYVSASGLTTSPIPYSGGIFEIEFDFIHHQPDDQNQPRHVCHPPAETPDRRGFLPRIFRRAGISGHRRENLAHAGGNSESHRVR